jgi:hypothetical protein
LRDEGLEIGNLRLEISVAAEGLEAEVGVVVVAGAA